MTLPSSTRYCPRCENKLTSLPKYHPVYGNAYDCRICEDVFTEAETDPYHGRYHGKPDPSMVTENKGNSHGLA